MSLKVKLLRVLLSKNFLSTQVSKNSAEPAGFSLTSADLNPQRGGALTATGPLVASASNAMGLKFGHIRTKIGRNGKRIQ